MSSTTTIAEDILGYVPKFFQNEAVELRFHSIRNHERKWQLVASVSQSGTVNYTLQTVPNSHYNQSMSNLGRDMAKCHLPMKAYEGWQLDLITYIATLGNEYVSNFYEIDEIL